MHNISRKTATAVLLLTAGISFLAFYMTTGVEAQQGAPRYVFDPTWPKPLPNNWKMGGVTGLAVDKDDPAATGRVVEFSHEESDYRPVAASMRELLTDLCSRIQATLINELLGPEDGKEIRYYVMGPGSTVMNESSTVPRRAEVRTLRTLDSLIREIKPPGFLKIDAQGFELEILKGATRLLTDIEAVLLEISLIEINEGAPLLHDVVAFMKARNS